MTYEDHGDGIYWAAFGAQMGLMLGAHRVTRSGLRAALQIIREEKRRAA